MIAEHRYVGVFAFLFACGLGFPVPEEVALIGGGYAVYLDDPTSWSKVSLMVTVAMAGVLVGDVLLWYIGRRVGENAEKLPMIGRHLTPARMRQARRMFNKHGAKAVFFGRFLFGIRAVTFFVSGSMRVPLLLFILMDGLAALITVPISVILAWHFGAKLTDAFQAVGKLDTVVLVGLGVIVVVIVGLFLRHRKRSLSEKDAKLIREESAHELAVTEADSATEKPVESEAPAPDLPPRDPKPGEEPASILEQ